MTSKLNVEKIQDLMFKRANIRNISVIAHVDHGKSTLTDALVSRAGLISESQSGKKRFTDNREDEIERGITIKSTAVSMCFEMKEDQLKENLVRDGNEFLVNLIDSPGHVDFSSEVTAALRVTDGAVLVVDVISGCSTQTETVLRQALSERIKPVLVINKIDRAILEQKLEPEKLYQRLRKIIDDVNNLISIYSDSSSEDEENKEKSLNEAFNCSYLDPCVGNVGFGAGRDGWAFTLTQFAQLYSRKTKQSVPSLLNRLWNNNYYDSLNKKWRTDDDEGKLQRGFNQFILEPLYKTLNFCLENNYDEIEKLALKLDIDLKIKSEDRDLLHGRELMQFTMKKWLPAADAMLELIVNHLPSPLVAQRYRCNYLYEGPLDDLAAIGIRECDRNACLMIYISKQIPDNNDKSKFFAFGRVFSGTAEPGMKVRIMGPNYKQNDPDSNDLFLKNLTRCVCMIGNQPVSFDKVPCGNIIALSGVDKYLAKSGTITNYDLAYSIKCMKFTVSPVVRCAVEPENPSDLNKFLEGLKRLCRSDQLVQCEIDNGQHVIAGAGELHLEICLRDLEKLYAKVPIRKSNPIVKYKETVTAQSNQNCLGKTPNKLNRIYMTAEPLSEKFCTDIEEGKITLNQDAKQRAKYLVEEHGFDVNESKKIWCFGPNQFDSNILVDVTKGVASSNDVTDTIVAGFQWGSAEGVVCNESLRGVRFNLTDLEYHPDPAHRKGAQLIPTVRRVMMSSMLTAKPVLVEPVYLVEIQCPETTVGLVYKVLGKKRSQIVEESRISGTLLYNIKAYLPVNESSGFDAELREATSGKAFPQCSFHHWQILPGDPFDVSCKAGQICQQIRRMKNLNDFPKLADYLDKL